MSCLVLGVGASPASSSSLTVRLVRLSIVYVCVRVCVQYACACLGCGLKFKFSFQMALASTALPCLCVCVCVCILFYDWRTRLKIPTQNARAPLCVCVWVCLLYVCELCKNILKLRRRWLQPPFAIVVCLVLCSWPAWLRPPAPCSIHTCSTFICHSFMHTAPLLPQPPFSLLLCHPLCCALRSAAASWETFIILLLLATSFIIMICFGFYFIYRIWQTKIFMTL